MLAREARRAARGHITVVASSRSDRNTCTCKISAPRRLWKRLHGKMRQVDSTAGAGSRRGERQPFVQATARRAAGTTRQPGSDAGGLGAGSERPPPTHLPRDGARQLGLLACILALLHQDAQGRAVLFCFYLFTFCECPQRERTSVFHPNSLRRQ